MGNLSLESDLNVKDIRSNTFTLEWPKNSGNAKEYPEIDKAQWFDINEAKKKILKGQAEFVDRLTEKLESRGTSYINSSLEE